MLVNAFNHKKQIIGLKTGKYKILNCRKYEKKEDSLAD